MAGEAAHLVPYALIAALTPLGVAATFAVIRAGRVRAAAFAVGIVAGQLAACALLVAAGGATASAHGAGERTFEWVLKLGLGFLLLGCAVVAHRRPATATPRPRADGRSKALLERLERVHTATALGFGLLLGIGGPKRLALTALAAASIAASGAGGADKAALVGWYGLLATVLVWATVLGYLLLGQRALTRFELGFAWLRRHRQGTTVVALVVVGVVLVADALALL